MNLSQAKVAVASLGMVLAVIGVALEMSILVWVAMAVLAVAMALRFWTRRPPAEPTDPVD